MLIAAGSRLALAAHMGGGTHRRRAVRCHDRSAMRARLRATTRSLRGTMLARVFAANVAVLVVALVVLSASPITVSSPVVFAEVALLAVGFAVLVVVNFVVLRRMFAPL